MPEETAIETQATELLRTLIKNGCVTDHPVMFHGHNERVDTESLKLSTTM